MKGKTKQTSKFGNKNEEEEIPEIPLCQLVFDKTINVEFRRMPENDTESRILLIRIYEIWEKLQSKNDSGKEDQPDKMKLNRVNIEIIDDTDLFGFCHSIISRDQFEQMKSEHELNIEFEDFSKEIGTLLDEQNQNKQTEYLVTFIANEDNTKSLEFNEVLELRAVEIFTLQFTQPESNELIQKAQQRFNEVKRELQRKTMEFKLLQDELKSNPIFSETLKRVTPRKDRK